jgi:hypothetical protein
MSVGRKALVVIALTVIGLSVSLGLTAQLTLLRGYNELEQRDARQDIQRMLSDLDDEYMDNVLTARSFAYSPGAYAFALNPNPQLINNYLYNENFVLYDANLVVLANTSGEVLFRKNVDISTGQQVPFPADFDRHLTPDSPLLKRADELDEVTGIVMVDDTPMLVLAVPILSSRRQGPSRGTFIVGRYFDAAKVQELAEAIRLPVSAYSVAQSSLPRDVRAAQQALSSESDSFVQVVDGDTIAGYALLNDLYGQPAAILKVEAPRYVHAQGQQSIRSFILLLLGSGAALGAVALWSLHRFILAPMTGLIRNIQDIGARSDIAARLPVSGQDELAGLATTINKMLEALQQAEKRLLHHEERFKLAVEATNDGLWDWNIETGAIYFSPRWCEMLGYTPAELEPHVRTWEALIHPDDYPAVMQAYRDHLEGKTPYCETRHRMRAKSGEWCWVLGRGKVAARDSQGKPLRVTGTHSDITDLKEKEDLIRAQNQALMKANQELALAHWRAQEATHLKSQFLATMSHELRTPLNAVIGYTEIILAGMTGPLTDEQRDYQQRVLANAMHLLEMINEVLDLSKIEAGRVEILQKPFVASELLDEVVYQTKGLLGAKSVRLEATLDEQLPPHILGDYTRLKQVMINLVSNAVKFTDEGAIHIEMKLADPKTWAIVVRDTGIGIPSHALEYIFEEFRQADGGSERRYRGTGLGLAIARRLVVLMRGNIRVASKVGEGSTFTVTLPLVIEHELIQQ